MSGPSDSSAYEPAVSAAPAKPKVIYVMGQGKSGSTILGVALGNCDGVFFAGEMCSWLMTSGRPILGGRERTLFWRGVREQMTDAEELFGGAAFESLERGLSPLRIDRWPSRRRLRERYLPV